MGQDPSAIREDIEATRGRMGETVDALTERTDAPARARQRWATSRDELVSTASATKDDLVGKTRAYISNPGRAARDARARLQRAWSAARENPRSAASGAGAVTAVVTGFVAMAVRARRGQSQPAGRGQAPRKVSGTRNKGAPRRGR